MTTRRETSAAKREAWHLANIAAATTEAARFWRTCQWLIAVARQTGRLAEVTEAVRGLVDRVRESLPLQDEAHRITATDDPAAPPVPWHGRGATPAAQQRRHVA